MGDSAGSVTARLWPLLVAAHDALRAGVAVSAAVHAAHGWNPTADRHLDRQLVRREAMERLCPWGPTWTTPAPTRWGTSSSRSTGPAPTTSGCP